MLLVLLMADAEEKQAAKPRAEEREVPVPDLTGRATIVFLVACALLSVVLLIRYGW